MSKTNTHWLNLALNRWNNSRATAKNITMPRDLDAFRKFYFGLALICISIPCHSDAPIFDVARFSSDPKSIVPQFQPAADHRVTRFIALQPDDLEQLNELISFIEQLAAYQ